MENKSLEKLIEYCGCKNINELWDYIGYLEDVKSDHEILKNKISSLYEQMKLMY